MIPITIPEMKHEGIVAAVKTLVVLPCFGEKKNLEWLIPNLIEALPRCDVLIVDDFSGDGTIELINDLSEIYHHRVRLLSRRIDKSYAKSLLSGLRLGLDCDYETLVQMDADGSHSVEDLSKLLEQEFDLVIGSRYVQGSTVVNVPLLRRAISRIANLMIRVTTGSKVADNTNAFRVFNRHALNCIHDLDIQSLGFAVQFELLTKMRSLNPELRIKEIPIEFKYRKLGSSKFDIGKLKESVRVLTILIMLRFRDHVFSARISKKIKCK